jgi:hypothetical protein
MWLKPEAATPYVIHRLQGGNVWDRFGRDEKLRDGRYSTEINIFQSPYNLLVLNQKELGSSGG